VTRAREWIRTFGDPAVLSDLRAAARACMATVCSHTPDRCDCVANRMTPDELVAWIEREVILSQQRPMRFERGHRPRTKKQEQLNLALAG
jgi:hypothetical protein